MEPITFDDLADYLRHGREIEFGYLGRLYSITNRSGFWYLCDDTDHICLDAICRFEDRETLVTRIAAFLLEDMTIAEIFDGQHVDEKALCIL